MPTETIAAMPTLNLVLDLVLILAMGGLWFLWMRTSRRQQQLQSLLLEAAEQLDTATRHLDAAMQSIERLQQNHTTQASRKRTTVDMTSQPEPQPQRPARPADAQATRILRMRREGDTPEMIADKLHLPLAQVQLMLKLHSPISHA